MAHLCTLMRIRRSPRTAYSSWTNGLVEVQNRNLGTHLRMILHDTPKDWAFQVHMYAYAHNSQPLSELNVSPPWNSFSLKTQNTPYFRYKP